MDGEMTRLFASRDSGGYFSRYSSHADLWTVHPVKRRVDEFDSDGFSSEKFRWVERGGGHNIGSIHLAALDFLLDKPLKKGECMELPKGTLSKIKKPRR